LSKLANSSVRRRFAWIVYQRLYNLEAPLFSVGKLPPAAPGHRRYKTLAGSAHALYEGKGASEVGYEARLHAQAGVYKSEDIYVILGIGA
jgi:hypothetical protein